MEDLEADIQEMLPESQVRESAPAATVPVKAATDNWPSRVNDCVMGLF